jgi:hypothetical protein
MKGDTTAGVPFMITSAMREALYARGLSIEQIAELTPEGALKILQTPDSRAVREFVATITAQAQTATEDMADPGVLQMVLVHPRDDDVTSIYRYELDDAELIERMTLEAVSASEAGHNVYVEGRTVRRGLSGKQRGGYADTAAVFALVIDSDHDKNAAWAPTVPMSLTVETSAGNAHYWLFLDKAVDADTGKRLGEQIRAATSADADTGNVCQPFRLAGTTNFPNKKKLERGRIVTWTRAVEFDPERLWNAEQIEQAFPRVQPRPSQGGGGGSERKDIPADTMRVIRDGVANGRSNAFFNVVLVLKRRGFEVTDVIDLLEQHPEGIAKKYEGRLQQEVERIWRKLKDTDDEPAPATIVMLTQAEFLADFIPPDYLVDGILQRHFAYSLTAITGHGKTALALLLARTVGCADPAACFGSHAAEKGVIVYFVGENPDDVRCRIIGTSSTRNDDPSRDRIHYIPGVFNIEDMRAQLVAMIEKIGGVDLIFVDTSAAYFLKDDENSNPQMAEHARMLRNLTTLPGGPCVVALCHPIKNANDPLQLVPRGGGAFLAAMDGNLTLWKHDEDLATLHHSDKWRGPGFEPITFKLEKISTEKLVDSKGRQLPTVHAVAISEAEEQEQEANAERDEDQLMAVLGSGNRRRSLAELAETCGWFFGNGEPYKSKVQRVLRRLIDARLVKRVRGGKYKLTKEGIEETGLGADDDSETVVDDRGGAISKEPFRAAQGAKQRDTVPCMLCGLLGEVYRCADARLPKGKRHYADLHPDCAEGYFTGGRSRRPKGGDEDLF